MAGASMNDIKARIKSVQSTMQITKAMELVATSKLRRAKENAERTRPYGEVLLKAIDDCLSSEAVTSSVWCKSECDCERTLFVVIAGDRGLAGGYNANIFRLSEAQSEGKEALWLPVGKKALEYLSHRGKAIICDAFDRVAELGVSDALELGRIIAEGYQRGDYDRVVVLYTRLASIISQIPTQITLLPLSPEKEQKSDTRVEFEGDPEEILAGIIPSYIGGAVYSAITESVASETAARRTAMNAANKNAEEMIDSLMLRYNRARQSIITQEITEIVSGAEAL